MNEEVLLQGVFIWVCLALDLTSPPLDYKEVGLQAAGLSTKPIFFLPKFAEKEWAEGNVYM